MSLKVVEIFRSIQGEGANVGRDATFIRLSRCNLSCWFCDTDFSQGEDYSIDEVLEKVKALGSNTIIWTGGEPTLQLTEEILSYFKGYFNCIETNGTNKVPKGIDYIACSPKIGTKILQKNFDFINEIRYSILNGDKIPRIEELPKCDNYFLSPIFVGEIKKRMQRDDDNIRYCLELIKQEPRWRISVQIHKILNLQ